MTAFAAVLHKRGGPPSIAGVGDALRSVYGSTPNLVERGACALLAAPLHHGDPGSCTGATSTVVGGVVLEGKRELAAALDEGRSASAIALVAAAHARWGDRFTEHLSGEYAFALWDSRSETFVCARDGMGLRLLYVADSADTLIVTNVLAAALSHPAIDSDIDEGALVEFLYCGGAQDATRTCYRHIQVLPAGHTLSIDVRRNATRMHRHWHFPRPDPAPPQSDGAVLEQYRSALADAVRDRIDDRGTSIFLSGGIDSTTIAATARRVAAPGSLHAITARYPGYATDDELPYARAAATHLDLPLTVIDANRHGAWPLPGPSHPTPEPLDEPMLADWLDAVGCAASHGSVALYGEDGDALFCPPGWRALRTASSTISIVSATARYVVAERQRPYLGLRWRERLGIRPARRASAMPRWLTQAAREALAGREAATILGHRPEPLTPHPTRPAAQDRLTAATYCRDFALTIAPELTRQRLELRFPLFDTRLVCLVLSLPAIPWCQHKALPRRAYQGRLPQHVLDRPKTVLTGFNEAVVAAWRRSARGPLTLDERIAPLIDRDEWNRVVAEGSPEAVMTAWRALALNAWVATADRVAPAGVACTP